MGKKLTKIVLKGLLALVFLSSLPYYIVVFYSFEPHKPFSGNQFYNPYAQLSGNWIKANFHAHSRMWGGLLHGQNSVDEMYQVYDSMEYDLPCLSNYNSLTDNSKRPFALNVYEHGINARGVHQLVLNAADASKFDYPLFQFTSHKQFLINQLKTADNLVALAHPSWKNSYTPADLEVLANYDLLEILSVNATSVKAWDHALSSGYAVWAIGNDDAHDNEEASCGLAWTMIDGLKKTPEGVIDALRAGRSYATRGWLGQDMNHLESITVEDTVYTIRLARAADSITLISDQGRIVAKSAHTAELTYHIRPEDTYVRAEVFETETWNTYTKMYFNPVIRSQTGELDTSRKEIPISWAKTLIYFVTLVLIHVLVIRIMVKW